MGFSHLSIDLRWILVRNKSLNCFVDDQLKMDEFVLGDYCGCDNNTLNSLTEKTCKELVEKGNNNPNKLSLGIQALLDTPLLLTTNIRPNRLIGVEC
ncbi:hypothetical protein QVD17_18822 [Tagetes erecta]|uniref:Uncharacterized protein n=1 Tax=Tagetes erecta TaxID=13708 RepID=A0AAD8KL72_TARER|nr:hypothetical protein QVD17_18822 [Tagetes erecta]